jgi:hypothetical protein
MDLECYSEKTSWICSFRINSGNGSSSWEQTIFYFFNLDFLNWFDFSTKRLKHSVVVKFSVQRLFILLDLELMDGRIIERWIVPNVYRCGNVITCYCRSFHKDHGWTLKRRVHIRGTQLFYINFFFINIFIITNFIMIIKIKNQTQIDML